LKETDFLNIIEFDSIFDGSKRELLISKPLNFDKNKKYNLFISPHFFGATYFENYYMGASAMLEPFKGWRGVSSKLNIIIAIPLGHGRAYDRMSLAYEGQIEDLASIPGFLEASGYKIGKVYAGGISMGGMETLTLAGRFPEMFSAVFSFNGIADLAAWCEDVEMKNTDKKMVEMEVSKLVNEEVGGSFHDKRGEYNKRSAINYVDNLAKVPTMIYWSSMESIVVNQELKQTKKLAEIIKHKDPLAKVYDYDHSFDHGFTKFDEAERIRCHEFCDFEEAAKWALSF